MIRYHSSKFNERSKELPSTRNIKDPQKNTRKTVSAWNCLSYPTFNLSETLRFILTQLQSTTQRISFKLCNLLCLKLHIFFTCFVHIIWLPVGNTRSKISHHHHHHISAMELGHLLTRSGLTYPEVSSKVCHDFFCQLGNSVSLPWVY